MPSSAPHAIRTGSPERCSRGLPRRYDAARRGAVPRPGPAVATRDGRPRRAGAAPAVLDVATGPAGVALALAAPHRRPESPASTSARTCCGAASATSRAAGAGRPHRLVARPGPSACRSPTPPSTRSRSPTCCATSPTRRRRFASWPGWCEPGGAMASLEFAVPPSRFWRGWWWLYTRAVLPVAGAVAGGRAWFDVGRSSGPASRGHYRRFPVDCHRRTRGRRPASSTSACGAMSLGGGLVMWGAASPTADRPMRTARASTPPAGARRAGATGGCCSTRRTRRGTSPTSPSAPPLAPRFDGGRLAATLLAFFLAVGVRAHALDELHGRRCAPHIPSRVLLVAAADRRPGRRRRARHRRGERGRARAPAVHRQSGPSSCVGYNLELFGGRLHNDVTFAAAWGAFPVLDRVLRAGRDASTCRGRSRRRPRFGLSHAQRSLSTPARTLRRRVARSRARCACATGRPELDARTAARPARASARARCRGPWSRSRSRWSSTAPFSLAVVGQMTPKSATVASTTRSCPHRSSGCAILRRQSHRSLHHLDRPPGCTGLGFVAEVSRAAPRDRRARRRDTRRDLALLDDHIELHAIRKRWRHDPVQHAALQCFSFDGELAQPAPPVLEAIDASMATHTSSGGAARSKTPL